MFTFQVFHSSIQSGCNLYGCKDRYFLFPMFFRFRIFNKINKQKGRKLSFFIRNSGTYTIFVTTTITILLELIKISDMKAQKLLIPALLFSLTAGTAFTGCSMKEHDNTSSTDSLDIDTVVYLNPGSEKPSCKINIVYTFLKPTSDKDSVSRMINSQIQSVIFGEQYAKLSPQDFIRTISTDMIDNYNTDVKSLFVADQKNGMEEKDIPAWYNYEYQISTVMEEGLNGIWNYTVTNFAYTGGAHPNTLIRMLNFDKDDSRLLTARDIILAGKEDDVCKEILKSLIQTANTKLETDTITCLAGLQENGILQDGNLYIPENFLVGKDMITFLYNQYDIAPYYLGAFILPVPYESIKDYLKIK
jgi:hypothetical protein